MIAEEDIKVGVKVKFTYDGDWGEPYAVDGNEYWIVEDSGCEDDNFFTKHTVQLFAVQVNQEYFTLVANEQPEEVELPLRKTVYDIPDTIAPHGIDPPTIARPVLSERKVGKVPIELVDTGFPHSLWELAKVLGWAAENKGYKPNDWKLLPDAKSAFQAAASRHRMKPLLGEEFDTESGLHHKVHEAFNVLAELELILTGKIK